MRTVCGVTAASANSTGLPAISSGFSCASACAGTRKTPALAAAILRKASLRLMEYFIVCDDYTFPAQCPASHAARGSLLKRLAFFTCQQEGLVICFAHSGHRERRDIPAKAFHGRRGVHARLQTGFRTRHFASLVVRAIRKR